MTDPEVPQTEKSSRSKAPLIVGGLVVVAIVVAGVFWLLRDDAPDEVNLDDAVAQVSTTTEAADTGDTGDTGSDDGSSTTGVAADGIEGEWTVDTETGEFDYESATGTFAGFRIKEELAGVGDTEAVGRTGDVTGSPATASTSMSSRQRERCTISSDPTRGESRCGTTRVGRHCSIDFSPHSRADDPCEITDSGPTRRYAAHSRCSSLRGDPGNRMTPGRINSSRPESMARRSAHLVMPDSSS